MAPTNKASKAPRRRKTNASKPANDRPRVTKPRSKITNVTPQQRTAVPEMHGQVMQYQTNAAPPAESGMLYGNNMQFDISAFNNNLRNGFGYPSVGGNMPAVPNVNHDSIAPFSQQYLAFYDSEQSNSFSPSSSFSVQPSPMTSFTSLQYQEDPFAPIPHPSPNNAGCFAQTDNNLQSTSQELAVQPPENVVLPSPIIKRAPFTPPRGSSAGNSPKGEAPPGHKLQEDDPLDIPCALTAGEVARAHYGKLKITGSLERLAEMPAKRSPILRPGKGPINTKRRCNVEALLAYIGGDLARVACKNCLCNNGPWLFCVQVPGQMQNCCTDCWFNASGARCEFHVDKQQPSAAAIGPDLMESTKAIPLISQLKRLANTNATLQPMLEHKGHEMTQDLLSSFLAQTIENCAAFTDEEAIALGRARAAAKEFGWRMAECEKAIKNSSGSYNGARAGSQTGPDTPASLASGTDAEENQNGHHRVAPEANMS